MRKLTEIKGNPLILSEKEVRDTLQKIGWNKIIDSVAETFIEEAYGRAVSPPKLIMGLEEFNNDYRMMPSRMRKYPEYVGTKIVSACSDNPSKHNLPLAMGIYLLNNAETQETKMIFDCTISTAYRTAAATAVAVRELSKPNAKTLGIIGCGQQAYYHIPAIKAVRNIEEVYVNDLCDEKVDEIAGKFIKLRKASKKDILNNLDIVVTMTPTKQPHIFPDDIQNREMTICSIGGDSKFKLEFAPEVLNKVDHFCDSYEQIAHTGTFSQAFKKGIISESDLKSLGSYMVEKNSLDNDKKVKMFFSTGVALEDLAMAILLDKNFQTESGFV
jgi:ornithine cyclodeaminase/alanine dehydrogenase-like protein (mu-crystallin family)